MITKLLKEEILLIRQGLNTFGWASADDIFYYIEENLTFQRYKTIKAFIEWLIKNHGKIERLHEAKHYQEAFNRFRQENILHPPQEEI